MTPKREFDFSIFTAMLTRELPFDLSIFRAELRKRRRKNKRALA